jgi:hypothetical protein
MFYKRNQVEEAIARIFASDRPEPPLELLTRIKRLLELDRSIGRKVRSKNVEEANFAFFSEAGPGTGADVGFSEYEAFALLNALRMMAHGWPQGFAVSIMRRVRVDLESEHARILRQPTEELFNEQAIHARARPGDIAVDNTDPVFLVIASKAQNTAYQPQTVSAVCRGVDNLAEFSREVGASARTAFEVATLAHILHQGLVNTEPRRRGRG